MAIPKQTFTWPINGGLDTQKSPLVVQPGSSLQLDNVIQTRLNEWRRRNGFTQAAVDTVPQASSPSMVAGSGAAGVVACSHQSTALYQASATSSKWKMDTAAIPGADDLRRAPMGRTSSNTALVGFSSDGTNHIFTRQVSSAIAASKLYACLFDGSSNTETEVQFTAGFNYQRAKCAAGPAGYLTVFASDFSGNLRAIVANTATGTLGAETIIKTGVASNGYFDCFYYTGTTVTIVVAMAAGGYQFIEFSPSALTKAVDLNKAVGTVGCISCIPEPSNSGRRMIGFADGTNTKIQVFDAAGTQIDLQTLEVVNSTQITGCATNSGLNAACVYQTAAGALRRNTYSAGAVGTAANVNGITTFATAPITLDGQGWGEPGDMKWFLLIGAHSSATDNVQHTTVMVANTFAASDTALQVQAAVVPLQGRATQSTSHLHQAVRTGTRRFFFGMPVLIHYDSPASGSAAQDYEVSAFGHTLLSYAELGAVNVGAPAYRGQSPVLPVNSLRTLDGLMLNPIGLMCPPLAPSVTGSTSTGALTLLGEYQWCVVIELEDISGNIWTSPPSAPVELALTGTQNTATLIFQPWQLEPSVGIGARFARAKLYRTDANGSTFRLVMISNGLAYASGDITFIDTFSDAAIDNAEILYTTGDEPTLCWPPASHCWMHGDRLWAVNRDFRTEVQYSRNLRANRQPETTESNVIDLDDECGDITNGCSLEGRGIIFKRGAIYFIQGDGLTDAGGGQNYTVDRVCQDVGSLPGTPLAVAGDDVYFVSDLGIYSVNKQAQTTFVGAAVDQYLNQPEVQTPETVYDGCFVPLKNEVRFVTTNYVLVYNRTFKTWTRWTGLAGFKRCLVVNGVMWLFKSDGTVWKEGTSAQTTDQGVAFTGVIRSPWMRPSFGPASGDGYKQLPAQNGIRCYRTRAIYSRTAGGSNATLIGKIYFNNDDTQVETFTSDPIAGATLSGTGEMVPQNSKCTSFSVALILPSGDTTVRVEGFSAVCGPRSGSMALPAGNRWS